MKLLSWISDFIWKIQTRKLEKKACKSLREKIQRERTQIKR